MRGNSAFIIILTTAVIFCLIILVLGSYWQGTLQSKTVYKTATTTMIDIEKCEVTTSTPEIIFKTATTTEYVYRESRQICPDCPACEDNTDEIGQLKETINQLNTDNANLNNNINFLQGEVDKCINK